MTEPGQNIIKIPEDAPLSEIIKMLNFFSLHIERDSKDPEFQKWIYEHQDWLTKGGE